MGLFIGLLTLPLAPVRGVVWIGEQVERQAAAESGGYRSVSRRLAEIEAAWQAGDISDQQRADLEADALRELPVPYGEDG